MCKQHSILHSYILRFTPYKRLNFNPLNISLLIFPIDITTSMNRWDRRLHLIRHGPVGVELCCDCRDNREYQ